jgi:prepilin-type N-terminal cleavage/methylation domain-containing protein/prepilin-type processing-associated H-X9-DG protein
MKRPGLHAFTLIELMVVVTIIALLLTLLMPAIWSVSKTAKLTQCTMNLYVISQAYSVRAADSRATPDQVKPLRVGSWKSLLLPYMENRSTFLVCPEANEEAGEPEPEYDPGNDPGVSTGGGGGYSGDPTGPGSGGSTPTSSVSTEDLKVEVWLRPGSPFRGVNENCLIYVMDCEPGQWARRYDAGMTTIGGGTGPAHVVPQGTYELGFEDSWNETWNDLYVRFRELQDGSLEITYVGENTGGNCYNLVNVTTGEQLLVGMGDGNAAHGWAKLSEGTTVVIKPDESQAGDPLFNGDLNGDSSSSSGAGGGGVTSATAGTYGMNSLADKVEGLASHVILVMDYKKTVARGPTTPYPDIWTNLGWQTPEGLPVFARHEKRINVLFSDGSVELVSPSDIDPGGLSGVRRLWDPARQR